MRFKKLLVGVDFSETSRQAIATGTGMAADTGAEVVLVHVIHLSPYLDPYLIATPVFDEAGLRREVDQNLGALVREAKEAGARLTSARTLTGVPWHEIVRLLETEPTFDLAIVGTHGRTGIEHVLVGSVAEKVVRHAPCPVLVVRAR